MASYITFIAGLIASVASISCICFLYQMKKLSRSLQQTGQELAELRFRLKERGNRNGITDKATLELTTEIVRIENNLSQMSKSSRHFKPLYKSVDKMKSILMGGGYEMVDYLARPYSPDIKAKAVFFSEGKIKMEDSVIISVQRAQVNYCGENIQQGHVTVVNRQLLLQHPKWVLYSLYKKIKELGWQKIPSKRICCC